MFNISYFNARNVFQRLYERPTPSAYFGVKIFGKGNFTNIHGVTRVLGESEINSQDFFTYKNWTVDTFLLAKMEGNTQGGNVTSLSAPITSWLIFRKGLLDTTFKRLAEIPEESTFYIDNTAVSNNEYIYQFLPKNNDEIGVSVPSIPKKTDFTKVILIEEESGDIYSFCLDLRLSEISIEESSSFFDTRGRYQTYLKGNKRVNVGSIGFVANSNSIGDFEIEQDLAYLKSFEDFILNGKEKLLKFPNGYSYRVITSNFIKSRKTSVNSYGKSVYVLSFSFREVGEI